MNYVYLLRCADDTLYCGWTTDLNARLEAHNSGNGAKYTRSRLPVELVYHEEYEDRHEALSREWHIKRMSRQEKQSLIDHYNGSERSVKTLSGGESFKASLSLALGLSEEIQSSAGGIRLDSMFVDEGFGSLDEDSLQQAMRALTGLTEGSRLVGIISHVSELKERIDKQIVVTKTSFGGSRAEISV